MQDPEIYLEQLGVTLRGHLAPERPAVLDADHRSYVNHEVYFFSSHEAREEFERDPLRYCGKVTDPVSETRFEPMENSPRFDYNGRPYFFASETTLAVFRAEPERFANPKRKMPEMDGAAEPDPGD